MLLTPVRCDVWMCGATKNDKVKNEHIRGTTRVLQVFSKITEKQRKWNGHVVRGEGGHILRRMLMLGAEIRGRRRRSGPNLRCGRDMAIAWLRDSNEHGGMEEKVISCIGDSRWQDKPSQGQRREDNKLPYCSSIITLQTKTIHVTSIGVSSHNITCGSISLLQFHLASNSIGSSKI